MKKYHHCVKFTYPLSFQTRIPKVDQHTGGKWLIHGNDQWYGCWSNGSLRRHVMDYHSIDLEWQSGPCHPGRMIATACEDPNRET